MQKGQGPPQQIEQLRLMMVAFGAQFDQFNKISRRLGASVVLSDSGKSIPHGHFGESMQIRFAGTCDLDLSLVEEIEAPSERAAGAARPVPGMIEAQATAFTCYREGDLSGRRYDPTASGGSLGYIVGSTPEWALQWAYPAALFEPGRKYDVWAVVRVAPASDKVEGVGITSGIWNTVQKVSKLEARLEGPALAPGKWQVLKIGTLTPEGEDYIWFAPTKNPTVKEIQLDRVLMVPVTPVVTPAVTLLSP